MLIVVLAEIVMVHLQSRARGRRGARIRAQKPPQVPQTCTNKESADNALMWLRIYFNTFLNMVGTVFECLARIIRCFVIAVILSCNAAVSVFMNAFREEFGQCTKAYGIRIGDNLPTTSIPFAKEPCVGASVTPTTPTTTPTVKPHRLDLVSDTITLDIKGDIDWFASPSDQFEHDVNAMRDYDWPELVLERAGQDDTPEIKKTKIVYDKCDDAMLDVYMGKIIGDSTAEIPVGEGYTPTQADFDKHMSPTKIILCNCKRDPGDDGYLCKRCLAKSHKERVDTAHLRGVVPKCNCARGPGEPFGGLCKRCRELRPPRQDLKPTVISCNCARKPGDPAIGLCARCRSDKTDRTMMSWRNGNKQSVKDLLHPASNWAGIKGPPNTVNEYKTVTEQQNGENMYDFILDEYNEMNHK